jgi:hypothetical protein
MPIRRSRVATLENAARGLAGMPLLGRRVELQGASVSARSSTSGRLFVKTGTLAVGLRASGGVAVAVAGGGHVAVSARRAYAQAAESSPGATLAAEASWLLTASAFGGWLAEQMVPTRESALLGALVGLAWARRRWRGWTG